MKKTIISFVALIAAGVMSFTTSSCKDADSVEDLRLTQALSPTSFKMVANADLTVTVSWSLMFNAAKYELIISQDQNFADKSQEAFSQVISYDYKKDTELSVTTQKLDPETQYYARLQAISADGTVTSSKYVYANVTTIAEQIMNAIAKSNIQSNSVTVTWTAGEVVKAIEVMTVDGTVEQTLMPSDAENQAGQMTITGLTSHTSYTIRLVSATGKTRGIRSFTTLLDLSGATIITQAQAADSSWVAAVEGAAAGTVFAFEGGNLEYGSAEALNINSNVVLAAKDITNMPILHTEFKVNNDASLYCYYLTLKAEGTVNTFPDQCFDFKSTGATGSLDVEGCDVSGYAKGLVYINAATVVNEINITGNLIHDIPCNGGDFIDSRKGSWNTLNFTDNTVVSCFIARDFLRSPKSSVAAGLSNVENNTFYNCGSGSANYRVFYTQISGAVNNFKSNVVAGFNNKRGFSNNTSYGTINVSNNVYFDCQNLTELADGNTEAIVFFDENGMVLTASPFRDADNGDFYLEDANMRLKKTGATRWFE